ncbi:hypothetical protein DL93DRAFT_2081547 [Clavulina sp. PMI_390]|nr:hypothetical protein DL93DRAFT_2081547 [Clavulina sp. PMI_390]
MQSLYTLGVRQTTAIQADLERLKGGDNSVALLGQISASLASFNRTVDDYDSMAKREVIKSKQEKALMRVQKFRQDYMDLKKEFDQTKLISENARNQAQRTDLLGDPSQYTTRQRFPQSAPNFPSASQRETISESPFSLPPNYAREGYALHEHSSLQETESQLDIFLQQGQDILGNLVDQRNILKGTHKRVLDAAHTIGLSRDVIGWIERRSREDTIIFVVGAIFTFFCFWLIWHYLG